MIKNLLAAYAESAAHHTGVHYAPSFNDFNSFSSDDLEEVLLHELPEVEQLGEALPAGSPRSAGSPSESPRIMTNKKDDWPMFTEVLDIHKIDRAMPLPARKDWLYDTPRVDTRSIWEIFVDHYQHNLTKDTFKAVANKEGYVTQKELRTRMGINERVAKALLAEADKDKDGRISYKEWCSIIEHLEARPQQHSRGVGWPTGAEEVGAGAAAVSTPRGRVTVPVGSE